MKYLRFKHKVTLTLLLASALVLIGSPAKAESEVVIVTTPPSAPVFFDECGIENDTWSPPADAGPWIYTATPPVTQFEDEVVDRGLIYATLSEGYELEDGSTAWTHDFWELSYNLTNVPCEVPSPPEPIPDGCCIDNHPPEFYLEEFIPAEPTDTVVEPTDNVVEDSSVDILPETGIEHLSALGIAAGILLAIGTALVGLVAFFSDRSLFTKRNS